MRGCSKQRDTNEPRCFQERRVVGRLGEWEKQLSLVEGLVYYMIISMYYKDIALGNVEQAESQIVLGTDNHGQN